MNTACFKSLLAIALAWCLSQSATPAALNYDWQFPNNVNPATVSPEEGGPAATATITAGDGGAYVGNATYYGYEVSSFWALSGSGSGPSGSDPNIALSIPGTPNQSLMFTLTVRQYSDGSIFKAAISYSIDGGPLQYSWAVSDSGIPKDELDGYWYDYTASWPVSSSLNPETVAIFGDPNGTMINSIQLGVEPVPEPIAGVLGAAGVAIAAAMFHQCRRRGGNSQPASRT